MKVPLPFFAFKRLISRSSIPSSRLRYLTLTILRGAILLVISQSRLLAQSGGGAGFNPTGVTGVFNGNSTVGCSVDPWTANFRREVTDIVVPGTLGAYPLKFTRIYNSREFSTLWEEELLISGPLGNSMGSHWRHSYSMTDGSWGALQGSEQGVGIVFPDGRTINLDPAPSYPTPLENEGYDAANKIWTMPDGGKVHLGHDWEGPSWETSNRWQGADGFAADTITDPYGYVTTIVHDPNCPTINGRPTQNRIWKVIEPGGKYLKFTYAQPEQGDPASLGLIEKIEAFDAQNRYLGISVTYHYEHRPPGNNQQQYERFLNRVDYSDGTYATYQWDYNFSQIKIADDPHYAGPMRHIEYGADGSMWAEWKQKPSVLVSGISGRSSTATRTTVTAKRGDGATQTFTYDIENEGGYCGPGHTNSPDSLYPCPGPFMGFLREFTDFDTKKTTIGYYEQFPSDGKAYRLIKSVTQRNGTVDLTTTYVRGYTASPAITRINYPDGSFMEQDFDNPGEPYYLASTSAQRKSGELEYKTIFTRDEYHRVIQIEYPHDISDPTDPAAYEHFYYTGPPPYGQVLKQQLKNGAWIHYEYNDEHLLKTKSNPVSHDTLQSGDPVTSYEYYGYGENEGTPEWAGRVKREIDPRGNATTYEYDLKLDSNGRTNPNGNPVGGRGLVTKISYPDGKFKSFGYNTFGDKLWETNELGQTTAYSYDDYGRVTSVAVPLPNNQTATTYSTYVPAITGAVTNDPYSHTTTNPDSVTSGAGIRTTNSYDKNWRKLSTTLGAQSTDPNSPPATTWFHYDDIGNQTYVTDPRGSATDLTQFTTHTEYDLVNRPWRITDAANQTTGSNSMVAAWLQKYTTLIRRLNPKPMMQWEEFESIPCQRSALRWRRPIS